MNDALNVVEHGYNVQRYISESARLRQLRIGLTPDETVIYVKTRTHLELVLAHMRPLVFFARELWPSRAESMAAALEAAVDEFLRGHPMVAGSRHQVAVHEAAHFVAYEYVGMAAFRAKICGSPGGHGGWGGTASCLNSPFGQSRGCPQHTAYDLSAEAAVRLAGCAAEHYLAGGDFYSSPGEIVATCLLIACLAQTEKCGIKQAAVEVLEFTASIIWGCRSSIFAIATLLERRRKVTCFSKDVAKVLRRVGAPMECQPSAAQIAELAQLIADAPIKLGALLKRVVLDVEEPLLEASHGNGYGYGRSGQGPGII